MPVQILDPRMPSANRAGSPRNLLTRNPAIMLASAGIEHGLGANDLGDDAAAIDVADQNHRHIGGAGKTHIGDIVFAQIDFRRRCRRLRRARDRRLRQVRAKLSSTAGISLVSVLVYSRAFAWPITLPCTTICAPCSLCGFKRTGFMSTVGATPRGARLYRLGAADFAAIRRHRGVVRHVLRLERAHFEAAIAKARHRPATISDLPTPEPVPCSIKVLARRLEQVPKKLTDFFDKDLLQLIEIERFLFDHMVPRDREAL